MTGYILDALINSLVHFSGFRALWTHKLRNYDLFCNLLILATAISGLLCLITMFYLIDILMKVFLYLYARYMTSLLQNALAYPRFVNFTEES